MRKAYLILIAVAALSVSASAGTTSRWIMDDLVFSDNGTLETTLPVSASVAYDDFTGPVLSSNEWNTDVVNSGTAAITVAIGGWVRLTTGAADDDDVELARELCWSAGKNVGFEARLKPADITGSAFVVGLTDSKAEGTDTLAVTYSAATLTSTASNCAVFFHDPDATTKVIRCVAVKADTDGTVTSTGTAAVNATAHVFKILINSVGDVSFWFDGALVYTESTGITTTTALTPYVGLINRESATNTLDVDYIRVWQDR